MRHNVRDEKGRFCKKEAIANKGYKGFKKGLICRNKQYKVGETYEEHGDKICAPGMMHFCESPLDVLNFYPAIDLDTGELNEFAKVEAIGEVLKKGNKSATNKLRIVRKISLEELIKAAAIAVSDSNFATNASYSHATTTISYSHAATTGDRSNAATTGYGSDAVTTGNYAKATTAGWESHAVATGTCSDSVAVGLSSYATTAGSYSKAVTTGEHSEAATSGRYSIAAALGMNSKAKAALGSLIVLAEYDGEGKPLLVKSAKVDGEKIKADTFYKLENGEFVEA